VWRQGKKLWPAGAVASSGGQQAAAALSGPAQRWNGLQVAQHVVRTEGFKGLYRCRALHSTHPCQRLPRMRALSLRRTPHVRYAWQVMVLSCAAGASA
jgi:hypothetical protein